MMNQPYFHQQMHPSHHHVFAAPHMGSQLKGSTDPSLPPPDPVSTGQYTHSYFSNPQIPVSTTHMSQGLSSHHHHASQQQVPSHQQASQHHHLMQHQQPQSSQQGRKRRASGPLMSLDVNSLHASQHQMGQSLMDDSKPQTMLTSAGMAQMVPMSAQPTTPTHGHGMPGSIPTPTSSGKSKNAKRSRTNVPWTAAEEMRLKEMREKGISWSVIAQSFPNRTEGGVKKHWYKDMHFAEFARDESDALVQALKEYDAERWKIVGQKVGKPAKACEQHIREHYPYLLKPAREGGGVAVLRDESDGSMGPLHDSSIGSIDSGLKNSDPTPT